jgi:hypothetical protein
MKESYQTLKRTNECVSTVSEFVLEDDIRLMVITIESRVSFNKPHYYMVITVCASEVFSFHGNLFQVAESAPK